MSTPQTKTRKSKLIQLIHIAKNKLKLCDAEYRAVLEGTTKKSSCKDMTAAELDATLKAMKALGFKVRRVSVAGKASADQIAYINVLWKSVARIKTDKALNAFIKRITGIAYLSWIDNYQAQSVILALRKLAVSEGLDPDRLPITI